MFSVAATTSDAATGSDTGPWEDAERGERTVNVLGDAGGDATGTAAPTDVALVCAAPAATTERPNDFKRSTS